MMKKLLLGNQALARGAYEAGVRVVSSYPGTPSTEITENIAKYDEIYSEWAPNEKVSAEVAIGAAIAGARSMCCMKHVGLNVAADPLFTVAYTGINAGLVFVVADDPGMHSSQNEQDSRHYARGAKVPMLEPSDAQECLDFVKLGYELSEKYDTPVFIRLTTRIAHSLSLVNEADRVDVPLKDYEKDAVKYVMMPGMARKRHTIVEDRMRRLEADASSLPVNVTEYNDTSFGIISSGISYHYAKEVFPDASYLKLGLVHPLPTELIKEFASKVDKLYVIEELDPFIEEQIKAMGIEVIGKEIFSIEGELSAEIVREKMTGEANVAVDIDNGDIPVRPPIMCSGCPHRGTFYVLKKMKLIVSGDIGCYTLGALPPTGAVDMCVCMGASIGMAHGIDKARGGEFANKTVAILGDSTFIHSGITGLIDVVYNKGASTVLILDNSITGMTGHQQNPSTGKTIKGEPTKQVDFVKLAEAIGVERISIVNSFEVDKLEAVLKEELNTDEPSVVIVQQPCALLKGVEFGNAYEIDQDKCKKCNMCLSVGCPSISKVDGKIEIDKVSCVGCGLCANICKFGAIKEGNSNE